MAELGPMRTAVRLQQAAAAASSSASAHSERESPRGAAERFQVDAWPNTDATSRSQIASADSAFILLRISKSVRSSAARAQSAGLVHKWRDLSEVERIPLGERHYRMKGGRIRIFSGGDGEDRTPPRLARTARASQRDVHPASPVCS